MVLAGRTLFVAGPPDVVDQAAAFEASGRPGDPGQACRAGGRAAGPARAANCWRFRPPTARSWPPTSLARCPTFDGMAAASGRLYLTTVDGRVTCLGGEGTPLAAAPPARLAALDIAVKPASFEPGRKARPSLQADFARVVHAEVTRSALGYHLLAESELPGLALKKLPAPRQGKIDLTVRIRVANDGELMNGFLAFGDGPAENRLVKCGLRFAQRKAMIVEGPLGRGKISAKPFDADETQVYTIAVHVDLPSGQVTMKTGNVTVTTALTHPPTGISYVGYATMNAGAGFSRSKSK